MIDERVSHPSIIMWVTFNEGGSVRHRPRRRTGQGLGPDPARQQPVGAEPRGRRAKFEACNHRFVHLEEPGWGVAVVNDSTYGHDVTRTVRTDGDAGTTTTVRVSLLRAPRFPDPETDQGVRASGTRWLPARASGTRCARAGGSTCRSGTSRAAPTRSRRSSRWTGTAVVLTAVKLADDGSGDVVVRFHEAHGGRARATLTTGFAVTDVQVTDLLERPAGGHGGPPAGRRPDHRTAASVPADDPAAEARLTPPAGPAHPRTVSRARTARTVPSSRSAGSAAGTPDIRPLPARARLPQLPPGRVPVAEQPGPYEAWWRVGRER
ncbi:hypothetical protein SVIOM342S_05130 [Streptomyces violaceorubidus]